MPSTTTRGEWYCPNCDDMTDVKVDNQSFDHEFGIEWLYDFNCITCNRTLATHTGSKLKPETEPE